MNLNNVRSAIVAVLVAVPLLMGSMVVITAQDADVTGTWVFDVVTDGGGGMPTLTLEQEGEVLTGHYSSANLGESDLTGTVKGAAINFSFDAEPQGQAMSVTYAGTVDGDSMSGTVDLGGLASGTFTGERQ